MMIQDRRGLRSIAMLVGLALFLGGAVLVAQDPAGSGETSFIASKASKVFHKPDCAAVKKIAAKSKVTLASAEAAIEQKYTPCPICKPSANEGAMGEMGAEKTDGPPSKIKGKKGFGKTARRRPTTRRKKKRPTIRG